MTGYKTYVGIIVTIVGMTGLSKYITSDQLTVVLNNTFEIAGIVLTIVGAIHKDIRIVDAESEIK